MSDDYKSIPTATLTPKRDKRLLTINLRLSPVELKKLDELAVSLNLNRSALIRHLVHAELLRGTSTKTKAKSAPPSWLRPKPSQKPHGQK
jgi:hypothetical protein